LREDVALLITHLECLRGAAHAAHPNRANWADRKDHFVAVNRAIVTIRLRIALEDTENSQFLAALTNLEDVAQKGDIATSDLIGPAVDKLTEECRTIVRREWTLIRKGEGVYLWSRYGAIAVIFVAVALLAGLIPAWVRANRAHGGVPQKQGISATKETSPEIKIYVVACGSLPLTKIKVGAEFSCLPVSQSSPTGSKLKGH
jgi:hypothetical protein